MADHYQQQKTTPDGPCSSPFATTYTSAPSSPRNDEESLGMSSDEDDFRLASPPTTTSGSNKRRRADSEYEDEDNLSASSTSKSTPPRKSNEEPLFPAKLFAMLEASEEHNLTDIVSWGVDGSSAFRVHKKREFEDSILPKHFKMTKYKSFTRQLHYYGFSWIKKGPDRGGYCHPNFLRSNPSKCHAITFRRLKRVKSDGTEKEVSAVSSSSSFVPPRQGAAGVFLDNMNDFQSFPILPFSARKNMVPPPPALHPNQQAPNNTTLHQNVLHGTASTMMRTPASNVVEPAALRGDSSFVSEQKLNPPYGDEILHHRQSMRPTLATRNLEAELPPAWYDATTPSVSAAPTEEEGAALLLEPRTIEEMTIDPQMEHYVKKYKTG